jgi:hypothetical protein
MEVLGGTEGDRLLAGLDEDLVLDGSGSVDRGGTQPHRHGHILDGVGDPFLGHFDLDAAKPGNDLIFMGQEGLADSVILGHEGKTRGDLVAARDVSGGEAEKRLNLSADSKGVGIGKRGVFI